MARSHLEEILMAFALGPELGAKADELHAQGLNGSAIARQLGVNPRSVQRYLKREPVQLYGTRHGRLSKSPIDLARCGTQANYQKHIRRGEEPCDACRTADRSNHKSWVERL
jgi:hypothetical protein